LHQFASDIDIVYHCKKANCIVAVHTEGPFAGQVMKAQPISKLQLDILKKFNKSKDSNRFYFLVFLLIIFNNFLDIINIIKIKKKLFVTTLRVII